MPHNTSPTGTGSPGAENEYNEAEHWNPEGLRKRIFNNEDLFSALLNSFLGDSEQNAKALLAAAESLDLKKLKEVSHLLKGVCGQLCTEKLHKICVAIEQVSLTPLDNIDSNYLSALCSDFSSELNTVERLFKDALTSDAQVETENADEGLSEPAFLSQIQQLQTSLEQSEYIDPDSLSPLKTTHKNNQALQNLVIRLIEEINLFDNDAASATLREIISATSNS